MDWFINGDYTALLDTYLYSVIGWFSQLDYGSLAWESLVLLLATAGAVLVQRTLGRFLIESSAAGSNLHEFRKLTRRAIQRIVFPFSMLLTVQAGRAVLAHLKVDINLLDLAIPLLLSLAAIRFAVYLLRKAFQPGPAIKASETFISTTVWLLVALHLVGWLPDVVKALDAFGYSMGDTRISLLTALELMLLVGVLMVIASWLSQVIERALMRSQYVSGGARVGIAKTAKFFLFTLAGLIALNAVGINLGALAVFGGALGVGLGFGLQRIASNFISGFILVFDRSIRPGDVISIGQKFGWVQELRARYIVVRDRDGVETLIPNETLITTEVINWSYSDQQVRLKIPVQISYADDPGQAMEIMLRASEEVPRVLQDPAPAARLMNFGESGLDLELRVWIRDPQQGVGSVRSDINMLIWQGFKDAGITIPYPQRDLHLKEIPASD